MSTIQKKKKYLLDFHAKCIEKNGQVLLSEKKNIATNLSFFHLKKKKKPLNDKVISNFKGHLTDSSG